MLRQPSGRGRLRACSLGSLLPFLSALRGLSATLTHRGGRQWPVDPGVQPRDSPPAPQELEAAGGQRLPLSSQVPRAAVSPWQPSYPAAPATGDPPTTSDPAAPDTEDPPTPSDPAAPDTGGPPSRTLPVEKVVYIKLHSTGSSTLTGILHRYCDNHGVKCFVHPLYEWPGATADRRKLMWYLWRMRTYNRTVDIWANHAYLEPDLFDRMVPGNVKVSLFREPFGRLMSSFGHLQLENLAAVVGALQANLLPRGEVCGPEGTRMSELVNATMFPLLDFVLITEKYNEGLVMMRRRYGWSKQDLMYLKFKVSADMGTEKHQIMQNLTSYLSQPSDKLTPVARFIMERCVHGDEAMIYKMAQDRFQSQWEALGYEVQQEVTREVGEFQVALGRLAECCSANTEDDYCKVLRVDNVEWVGRHHEFDPFVETECSRHGFF